MTGVQTCALPICYLAAEFDTYPVLRVLAGLRAENQGHTGCRREIQPLAGRNGSLPIASVCVTRVGAGLFWAKRSCGLGGRSQSWWAGRYESFHAYVVEPCWTPQTPRRIIPALSFLPRDDTMPSQDGYYEALWPRSPRQSKVKPLAKRLDTLNGKTIADRKSTRLNSSHIPLSRMPSSA